MINFTNPRRWPYIRETPGRLHWKVTLCYTYMLSTNFEVPAHHHNSIEHISTSATKGAKVQYRSITYFDACLPVQGSVRQSLPIVIGSYLQWPQSTKFSLLRTPFFSNKWCREENKWCGEENKWCGEENKWCREENKWCGEENKWCREENKWCGEENKWCREENKWCGEEYKWCREEKVYFGATVHILYSISNSVCAQSFRSRSKYPRTVLDLYHSCRLSTNEGLHLELQH